MSHTLDLYCQNKKSNNMKFISKSADADLQKLSSVQYSTLCDWLRIVDNNVNRLINQSKNIDIRLQEISKFLVTEQEQPSEVVETL